MKMPMLPTLLLALPAGSSAPEADPVQLSWRLPEGARFEVEASQNQTSTTSVMGQTQDDSQDQSARYLVEVASVSEEGVMDLSVSMLSMRLHQENPAMTLTMTAERGEDGAHDVDIEIESNSPGMDAGMLEDMMVILGENLIDMEYAFSIDAQGELLESNAEGDLLANMPVEGETSEMMILMLESMFSPDDLAATMGAELLFGLPAEPASVGDTWSVERSKTVGGMDVDGKGEAKLQALEGEGDARVAVLIANIEYDVDTADFVDRMEEMMNSMYEQMGMDMEATVDLEAAPFTVERRCRFDIASGLPLSLTVEEMRFPLDGTMSIADQSVDMEMEVVVTEASTTWTRSRD